MSRRTFDLPSLVEAIGLNEGIVLPTTDVGYDDRKLSTDDRIMLKLGFTLFAIVEIV